MLLQLHLCGCIDIHKPPPILYVRLGYVRLRVILAKFSASFFPLKTQNINRNHFILCSSANIMMGKTLITTQQARGPTGRNRGHWVGRIKVTEITRQPRGTLWEGGVLGGEHRLAYIA